MMLDRYGLEASPGARSECSMCGGRLLAKCGQIVSWHWAHETLDCDPWAEPESEWHLGWKRYFASHGARIEVVMGNHRADVVTADGQIVELQSDYLSVEAIAAREEFYGERLTWLYRCHWSERLQYGRRGFWWKHGSKAMTQHQRPVWWDLDDELIRVDVNLVEQRELLAWDPVANVGHYAVSGHRVLGRVLQRRPSPR